MAVGAATGGAGLTIGSLDRGSSSLGSFYRPSSLPSSEVTRGEALSSTAGRYPEVMIW